MLELKTKKTRKAKPLRVLALIRLLQSQMFTNSGFDFFAK